MGGKCLFGRGKVCKFITTALALYPDFTQYAPFCRKGPFQRKSSVCDDFYYAPTKVNPCVCVCVCGRGQCGQEVGDLTA